MTGTYRQHVPRPPGSGPAFPPPWQDVVGSAPQVPLGRVRAALAHRLPDPPPRQRAEAAVLLACYPATSRDAPVASAVATRTAGVVAPDDGEAVAVLIRRSWQLGRDPGHVALPGGLVEPGEAPLAAALREAEEEVGLDPLAVELLGPLATVERPRRSGAVVPFVGLLPRRPVLTPSPDEVEAVLEVPLAELLAEGVAWEERWPLPGVRAGGDDGGGGRGAGGSPAHVVRFFACERLGDDLVWGVTARILWDLLERVARTSPAPRSKGRLVPPGHLD